MKIQIDKILHFVICAVIAIIVVLISVFVLHNTPKTSLIAGMFFALFIGVCKELYDVFIKKSNWDKWDLLADLLGAIVGAGIGVMI